MPTHKRAKRSTAVVHGRYLVVAMEPDNGAVHALNDYAAALVLAGNLSLVHSRTVVVDRLSGTTQNVGRLPPEGMDT